MENIVSVHLYGDNACFSRPESKTDPVSYPVPTPSSARNILQAIYWKPEFQYQIVKIDILKPIQYENYTINGIKHKVNVKSQKPIIATNSRTQINYTVLKNVSYVIYAEIIPNNITPHELKKHMEVFNRRVKKGQCFRQPHFGLKNFVAFFEENNGRYMKINYSENIGRMFYDFDYKDEHKPHFFDAMILQGTVIIPTNIIPEM